MIIRSSFNFNLLEITGSIASAMVVSPASWSKGESLIKPISFSAPIPADSMAIMAVPRAWVAGKVAVIV